MLGTLYIYIWVCVYDTYKKIFIIHQHSDPKIELLSKKGEVDVEWENIKIVSYS